MTIKWQRGNYIKFYAKMKIRIGNKDQTIDKIESGDEFEYDGSMLKYAGAEIQSTQLRGAIGNGWASTIEDDDTSVSSFVPNRNVAKSKTVNTDLSRVQRSDEGMEKDYLDEDTILKVSDRGKTENLKHGASPNILTKNDNRKGMNIEHSEVDGQEGIIIGRVRSKAKTTTDVYENPSLAITIENSEIGRPILTRNANDVTVKTTVSGSSSSIGGEENGHVVGSIRKSSKISTDGIEVLDTSNLKNKVKQSDDSLLPKKIRLARKIDPNFPANWSFTGKLAERLNAAKQHGITDKFLEALYMAEGDQMRKLLEKTFPKHFE